MIEDPVFIKLRGKWRAIQIDMRDEFSGNFVPQVPPHGFTEFLTDPGPCFRLGPVVSGDGIEMSSRIRRARSRCLSGDADGLVWASISSGIRTAAANAPMAGAGIRLRVFIIVAGLMGFRSKSWMPVSDWNLHRKIRVVFAGFPKGAIAEGPGQLLPAADQLARDRRQPILNRPASPEPGCERRKRQQTAGHARKRNGGDQPGVGCLWERSATNPCDGRPLKCRYCGEDVPAARQSCTTAVAWYCRVNFQSVWNFGFSKSIFPAWLLVWIRSHRRRLERRSGK